MPLIALPSCRKSAVTPKKSFAICRSNAATTPMSTVSISRKWPVGVGRTKWSDLKDQRAGRVPGYETFPKALPITDWNVVKRQSEENGMSDSDDQLCLRSRTGLLGTRVV